MENLTQKRKVEAENETFFSRGEIAWIALSCTFLRSHLTSVRAVHAGDTSVYVERKG